MKCFCYLKDKARSRVTDQSAPELRKYLLTQSHSADGVPKSSGSAISSRGIADFYQHKAPNLRVFTFSDLSTATNHFNSLLKIGEGGFGSGYKGRMNALPLDAQHPPMFVAVKKLKEDGFQGQKQCLAEVQFLGVVDHPNLVKLIGYCALDGKKGIQRLLVYEYMPNKGLGDHLFRKAYPVFPWEKRVQIMLGAAQGLAYLHEELQVQVIFHDFKASNVLLDEDFQAKLSDFGRARQRPTAGHTHVSTVVS